MFFSWSGIVQPIESASLSENEKQVIDEITDSKKTDDGRRPLAIIRRFNPEVFIKSAGKEEWESAKVAYPLFNADSLVTSDTGFAMIQFMDNSIVRMRPSSLLVIGGESKSRESTVTRLTMSAGEIFVSVTGLGESTEVVTPSAVAAVRGTNFAVLLNGSSDDDDRCGDYDDFFQEPDEDNPAEDTPENENNQEMNDGEGGDNENDENGKVTSFRDILEKGKTYKEGDDEGCYDKESTIVIGFEGSVEVNPTTGEESFVINGGDVILINEDGEAFEFTLSEDELQELLDDYTADDANQTRTRTLELRFVNEAGEVEIITIEYEEDIDNE